MFGKLWVSLANIGFRVFWCILGVLLDILKVLWDILGVLESMLRVFWACWENFEL